MLSLDRPVIVEGKYDKIRLSRVISSLVITTDGFGVFKGAEKQMLIRRLAAENGVIVLTDPDGAGLVIRNFLRGILRKDQIINVYAPSVPGKEKRKKAPSKEGLLGVEGIDDATLEKLFLPFAKDGAEQKTVIPLTKSRLYEDGFSGREDSARKRVALAAAFSLPANLSADALLEAVNLLGGVEAYESVLSKELSE